MKKIKFLLLLCLLTIVLTGCVKLNANMDIKDDKSMDFTIVYAFDKTYFGEDNSLKEEDLAEVKKQGFTITKYSEGNYEGFTLTQKIANIDEVSTENDVIYDLSGMASENVDNKYIFKVVKANDKNTYTAKIKFDGSNEVNIEDGEQETPDEVITTTGANDATESGFDYSKVTENMDLSFSVTLPSSAISSNATTKENDNKKLSWKLAGNKEEFIEFAFAFDNNNTSNNTSNNTDNNMTMYIGVGIGVLVLLIVIVILLSKGKKKPSNNPNETEPKKMENN